MDKSGRLVIPKKVRNEAGLSDGMPLELRVIDGGIELKPEPVPRSIEESGAFFVAKPLEKIPPLEAEIVRAVISELRES